MTQRAKLFQSEGSQAVRLPKGYCFDDDEVWITRQGRQVILEPVRNASRAWSREFLMLAGSAPDFPDPDY